MSLKSPYFSLNLRQVFVRRASVVFWMTLAVASFVVNGLKREVLQVINTRLPSSYAFFFWLASTSARSIFSTLVSVSGALVVVTFDFDLHPIINNVSKSRGSNFFISII